MNLPTEQTALRSAEVEQVVQDLMPRVSQLSRLVVKHAGGTISRSEGGVLSTLSRGARRVTELAELEGLAQPTTTILVKRLEDAGWVERRRDPTDGRAVIVSLTPAGGAALEEFRAQYRVVLRDQLATLPDEHVTALAHAIEALDALVAAIQKGDHR